MNSTQIVLLALQIALIVGVGTILYFIHHTYQLYEALAKEAVIPDADEELLTAYELERLEREEEFNTRIARIKEELAMQQAIISRSTKDADELHPLVKNLPHNSISERYNNTPDIEYAE